MPQQSLEEMLAEIAGLGLRLSNLYQIQTRKGEVLWRATVTNWREIWVNKERSEVGEALRAAIDGAKYQLEERTAKQLDVVNTEDLGL